MKIYFFRHGQTEFNLQDRFQGICDSALTEKGVEQAIKIGTLLDNIEKAKVIVSPAKRVLDTVEIALYHKFELQIDKRLMEVCYGQWEGKSRNEIDNKILKERSKNRYSFVHPGEYLGHVGESYEQIFPRVKSFCEDILTYKEENIFVFSHNGVLLNIYKYFNKLSNEEVDKLRISNNMYLVYDGVSCEIKDL